MKEISVFALVCTIFVLFIVGYEAIKKLNRKKKIFEAANDKDNKQMYSFILIVAVIVISSSLMQVVMTLKDIITQ